MRSQSGTTNREFVQASQAICPPIPTAASASNSEPKTGTNILDFDRSSILLATRTEDMTSTIWVWDVRTHALRAVLILHAPIAKVTWHPTINELLMIRCEGEESRGLVHLWDPSWEIPKIVDFSSQIPGGKVLGKTVVRWLNIDESFPVLFFSDTQDYLLASVSETDDGDLPWQESQHEDGDMYGQGNESLLSLVAADAKPKSARMSFGEQSIEDGFTGMSGESDEMEDTFHFRKFAGARESTENYMDLNS